MRIINQWTSYAIVTLGKKCCAYFSKFGLVNISIFNIIVYIRYKKKKQKDLFE